MRPNFYITILKGIEMSTAKALSEIDEGRIVIIEAIRAGRRAHQFLADLGLHNSEKIRIVKNDSGPVIIEIKGTRVAIGRGLASKIDVSLES